MNPEEEELGSGTKKQSASQPTLPSFQNVQARTARRTRQTVLFSSCGQSVVDTDSLSQINVRRPSRPLRLAKRRNKGRKASKKSKKEKEAIATDSDKGSFGVSKVPTIDLVESSEEPVSLEEDVSKQTTASWDSGGSAGDVFRLSTSLEESSVDLLESESGTTSNHCSDSPPRPSHDVHIDHVSCDDNAHDSPETEASHYVSPFSSGQQNSSPADTTISKCPTCNKSMAHMSEKQRESHSVMCALRKDKLQKQSKHNENQEYCECKVCGKDITRYTKVRKSQHVNRCLDRLAREKETPLESDITEAKWACPVCGKNMSNAKVSTRISHLKSCAKENQVKPSDLRKSKSTGKSARSLKKSEEKRRGDSLLAPIASNKRKKKKKKKNKNRQQRRIATQSPFFKNEGSRRSLLNGSELLQNLSRFKYTGSRKRDAEAAPIPLKKKTTPAAGAHTKDKRADSTGQKRHGDFQAAHITPRGGSSLGASPLHPDDRFDLELAMGLSASLVEHQPYSLGKSASDSVSVVCSSPPHHQQQGQARNPRSSFPKARQGETSEQIASKGAEAPFRFKESKLARSPRFQAKSKQIVAKTPTPAPFVSPTPGNNSDTGGPAQQPTMSLWQLSSSNLGSVNAFHEAYATSVLPQRTRRKLASKSKDPQVSITSPDRLLDPKRYKPSATKNTPRPQDKPKPSSLPKADSFASNTQTPTCPSTTAVSPHVTNKKEGSLPVPVTPEKEHGKQKESSGMPSSPDAATQTSEKHHHQQQQPPPADTQKKAAILEEYRKAVMQARNNALFHISSIQQEFYAQIGRLALQRDIALGTLPASSADVLQPLALLVPDGSDSDCGQPDGEDQSACNDEPQEPPQLVDGYYEQEGRFCDEGEDQELLEKSAVIARSYEMASNEEAEEGSKNNAEDASLASPPLEHALNHSPPHKSEKSALSVFQGAARKQAVLQPSPLHKCAEGALLSSPYAQVPSFLCSSFYASPFKADASFCSPSAVMHHYGSPASPMDLMKSGESAVHLVPSTPPTGKVPFVSPTPDYSSMPSAELKQELAKYGVRGHSRKWMIDKLTEIWKATHDEPLAPESSPFAVQQRRLSSLPSDLFEKVCTPNPSRIPANKEPKMTKEEKKAQLKKEVISWIRNNGPLYTKILKYQVVDIIELQKMLQGADLQCSRKFLAGFLDEQGIVFEGLPKSGGWSWKNK